jgi:hypothetical protein
MAKNTRAPILTKMGVIRDEKGQAVQNKVKEILGDFRSLKQKISGTIIIIIGFRLPRTGPKNVKVFYYQEN